MKNVSISMLIALISFSLSFQLSSAELNKHIVESNGHPMTLWHKVDKKNLATSKQILLLHGRTWSSLPDFDLQVEGEHLSLMDNFVELGFSVWALDARGYGETARDKSGWNTPNQAAEDVANVATWIKDNSGKKPTVFGWSNGAKVALLMIQKHPSLAKSIILFGFPIDPDAEIKTPKLSSEPAKAKNTAKNAASDFIVTGSISHKAIDIYVRESLKADPIRADWNHLKQWEQLDASKVTVPLLLIQAEHDPLADSESHARFFVKLPNANKQWVVLAGGDHAALLETAKYRLVHSVNNFVEWLELD